MTTPQDTAAERAHALETLTRLLAEGTGVIYTKLDPGTGETDYITVYVIAPGYGKLDAAAAIHDVTYFAARVAGRRMHRRGVAVGGGQFNKGLDVADDIVRAVHGRPLDQVNEWTELPR